MQLPTARVPGRFTTRATGLPLEYGARALVGLTMRTLISLLLLSFAACTTFHAAAPVLPSTSHALIASLERGACFGKCPMYVVRVFADGAVEFEGQQNVATTGKATVALTQEEVAKVAQAFEAARFDTLKPEYANQQVSDMAWVTVSNGAKTVRHYTGDEAAPAALTELEATLDQLTHASRWATLGQEQ